MTVDNLFIFHDKVKAFGDLGRVKKTGDGFLITINNKSTAELLKK